MSPHPNVKLSAPRRRRRLESAGNADGACAAPTVSACAGEFAKRMQGARMLRDDGGRGCD